MNLALAAALFYSNSGKAGAHTADLLSWRNSSPTPCCYQIRCDDTAYEVNLGCDAKSDDIETSNIETNNSDYSVTVNEQALSLSLLDITDNHCVYEVDGVRRSIDYIFADEQLYLDTEQGNRCFDNVTYRPASAADGAGSDKVLASMDGVIVAVKVKVGDRVEIGETVVLLEAMKMEHQLKAQLSGTVAEIAVTISQQVKGKQLLVRFEQDQAEV